jgi:hypothetical protein
LPAADPNGGMEMPPYNAIFSGSEHCTVVPELKSYPRLDNNCSPNPLTQLNFCPKPELFSGAEDNNAGQGHQVDCVTVHVHAPVFVPPMQLKSRVRLL